MVSHSRVVWVLHALFVGVVIAAATSNWTARIILDWINAVFMWANFPEKDRS